MSHFTSPPSVIGAATSRYELTPRQREAVALVAGGKTYAQAAIELGCSPRTVESHVRTVMNVLDIHNRAALTRYAIHEGLVGI